MYYEYKHNTDKDTAKQKVDSIISELQKQKFAVFETRDFAKMWTGDEMQITFYITKGPLDRRVKGNIKVTDDLIKVDAELPDMIKNFVPDRKIEAAMLTRLDGMFRHNGHN